MAYCEMAIQCLRQFREDTLRGLTITKFLLCFCSCASKDTWDDIKDNLRDPQFSTFKFHWIDKYSYSATQPGAPASIRKVTCTNHRYEYGVCFLLPRSAWEHTLLLREVPTQSMGTRLQRVAGIQEEGTNPDERDKCFEGLSAFAIWCWYLVCSFISTARFEVYAYLLFFIAGFQE